MNTTTVSRTKAVLLGGLFLPVLAACKPSSAAVPAADTPIPPVVQYSGSGISTNSYAAVLKAGIARFRVTSEGVLTVDIDGPNGFHSQVQHLGRLNATMSEVQIPADGTYQISIDHAGLGGWKVVIDMSGAAPAPENVPSATPELAALPTTESPSATPEPVQAVAGFQFTGSGVSISTHAVVLPAGIVRFRIITDSPMTITIGGPNNFLAEVLHPGLPSETAHEVQIPAAGTYGLAVEHAGAGSWTVIIDSLGGAEAPPPTEAATATVKPTDASPAALVYTGSGMSVWVYKAALRAGNALFAVEGPGVLTVDIDGPGSFYFTVDHPGLNLVTKTTVQIPLDGTYQFTISHVGSTAWKVTITQ
jgi:hypothetical protein